jgi:glycosyltransferase involved in cell wall biosynthesis
MKVDAQDIEVFILTCNRAGLLQKAIESLLRQTVGGFPITVLDNASSDDTATVVASFQNPTVRIVTSERNLGGLGNILRGQQFAARKFMMLFHDDDQLHPKYIETVLNYLGHHSDAALVVSNSVNIEAGSSPVAESVDQSSLKLDRAHFASVCYLKNKIAFSSAVYRTDLFKVIDLAGLSAEYGKWGDRPIMIEAVNNQRVIVLEGAFTYSGRHPGQDQHAKGTQPPHTSWLNRERYFRNILGDDWATFPGKCFCMQSHRRLKSGYKRRIVEGVKFPQYLQDAFTIGATTAKAWRFRFVALKPVQSLFNGYSKGYLQRHFHTATSADSERAT